MFLNAVLITRATFDREERALRARERRLGGRMPWAVGYVSFRSHQWWRNAKVYAQTMTCTSDEKDKACGVASRVIEKKQFGSS